MSPRRLGGAPTVTTLAPGAGRRRGRSVRRDAAGGHAARASAGSARTACSSSRTPPLRLSSACCATSASPARKRDDPQQAPAREGLPARYGPGLRDADGPALARREDPGTCCTAQRTFSSAEPQRPDHRPGRGAGFAGLSPPGKALADEAAQRADPTAAGDGPLSVGDPPFPASEPGT